MDPKNNTEVIPLTHLVRWQDILKSCFTKPDDLLNYLNIRTEVPEALQQTMTNFPMRVPLPFAQRMRKGDLNDPLLLQVLPQIAELETIPGFTHDPLCESHATAKEGLLHKYHGRVLLVTTSSCAIHCRYCFRRHFPYDSHRLNKQHWLETFDYIAQDGTISEVILSGGDPLNCANHQLEWISHQLEKIPHIKRLRIHTRLPIAIPQRVDSGLLSWLANCRLKVVMVLHCNHPNEIDEAVRVALSKLSDIKIPLLNQSVLLAKVNDRVDILAELSEQLFDCGVQPYYLHLLDKVTGSAHFDLENHKVEQLYRELFEILPGYLVPKLVREVAGAPAKVPALSPVWG